MERPSFRDVFKSLSGRDKERAPEDRERGKNVDLTFSFRRHEQPGKTPDGMSADFLTAEGVEHARELGKGLAKEGEYAMFFGSQSVQRARETAGHMIGSFRDEAGAGTLINAFMEQEKQRQAGHGDLPPGDVAIYRSHDLDPVAKFAKVNEAAKAAGAKTIDESVQYWLDHPEKADELGSVTSETVAGELAHRLALGMKMSDRLYAGLDVRVENLTHGPKLEALLKEVMLNDNGTRGFTRLEEIGGMFQPGENIDFAIHRDGEGELALGGVTFRGKRHDIDERRLQELATQYQEAQRKTAS